ncbi:MAG: preprotein translocase subunit SecE [Acidobacteriota bacterium]|nr:preprotein translocase subunit SecE [Acidobacteriota bacterium]
MLESLKVSRINQFFGDVKMEMRKVSWPGRKEVYGTTIVVLCAVFFFGIYLGLVDTILQYGVQGLYGWLAGR